MTSPVGLVLLAVVLSSGQEPDDPKYPKVNVASDYQVEARWPKRPDDMTWAAVSGLAVDGNDHVYIFTRAENPVQVYKTDGTFVRSWGRGVIQSSHHLKIGPDGNVWIADIGRHVVEKYTPDGKLLLRLGRPGEKGSDETHLYMPTDMAVSPEGDVFVADGYGNARIVHFTARGAFVKAWGKLGSKPGEFSIPHAIAIDSKQRLYVADRNNVRVQVFDTSGKLLDVWANVVTPWGFCVTPKDEIWVCGSSPMQWRPGDDALGCPPKDQVFMKFSPQGKLLQLWTTPKGLDGLERAGECNWVHALAFDSAGNLYAGDIIGKRAQKFRRVDP